MGGLRSKSAVTWSDEEEEEEDVNVNVNERRHHQHRSSAEKLEIYKQKLFSPKNLIAATNDDEDSKFAFHAGADAVKTMTGLMINESMMNNQMQQGKGKKNKKKNKLKKNPMHDYHSK